MEDRTLPGEGNGAVGGEGGIRTHGTLARTTVFETVPIDRSGTSPLISCLIGVAVGPRHTTVKSFPAKLGRAK